MAPRFRTILLDDFSRGINLLDDLEPGFVPDGFNVNALDKRLVSRWGAPRVATLASAATYIFDSQALNRVIVQRGTEIYAYETIGWTGTLLVTLATSTKIQAVDFNSQVVLSTANGIYTTDGTAVGTVLRTGVVIGCKIAVWENKVFSCTGRTLYWSAAGNAASWTTATDTNAIREPDDTNIEAIGVGNGLDVIGRTGLLVWKRNSRHRVLDSDTGEYVTLGSGPEDGANGNEAVAAAGGRIFFGNDLGVYEVVGDGAVCRSDAIGPFWRSGGGTVILGNSQGRLVATIGDSIWEMYENGSWWRSKLWTGAANSSIISFASRKDTNSLVPAYILDTAGTSVLKMWRRPDDRSGDSTDRFDYVNATPTSKFVLPWVQFGLDKARIRRAIVHGWGNFITPYIRTDYDHTLSAARSELTLAASGPTLNRTGQTELHSFGVCRAIAFEFQWVGGLDFKFTGVDATTWTWPGVGISGLRLDVVPLGRA